MKRILSIITVTAALFVSLGLMAFEWQQNGNGKNNGKGNQKQDRPEKNMQQNKGKANGNENNNQPPQSYRDKANKGRDDKDNNGNRENGKRNDGNGRDKGGGDDMRDQGNPGRGNARVKRMDLPGNNNWYSWTEQNFKNRKELRNKGKVTICHKFNSGDPVTITVSENAMKAHLGHGDVVGSCPAVSNSVFSDIFQKRRTEYYNDLYYGQDQYNYSNSILEYALARLTNSRSQLDLMRTNGTPQSVIDQRQASVLQLEENVSLLEVALGVASQLLVNKLSQ